MNNIFENAYFGKPYKTRDGRKAIYHCGRNDVHWLIFENGPMYYYNNNGLYDDVRYIPNDLDIVSEWQELTTKEEMIDKACDVFADIINEVLPINASDMPYIKKFRKAMEDEQ